MDTSENTQPDPLTPADDNMSRSSSRPGLPEKDDTDRSWLAENGFSLAVTLVLLGFGIWKHTQGSINLWDIMKVILGLGLVVFIHELGHFLAAKWSDVHVETFSIGFGRCIPGCQFKYGETTYKVGWIPLGGYVKMVGEGENEESDEAVEDPRSFKNKSVGKRMLIISAGVCMNIVLASICFLIAYSHGVEEDAAIVGAVAAGSPAWEKGLHSQSDIVQIDDIKNPVFNDIRPLVMSTSKDEEVRFLVKAPEKYKFTDNVLVALQKNGVTDAVLAKLKPLKDKEFDTRNFFLKTLYDTLDPEESNQFQDRILTQAISNADEKLREIVITPIREKDELYPMIGINPASQLTLFETNRPDKDFRPYRRGSAAEQAQPGFQMGDRIVACSVDPKHPEKIVKIPVDQSPAASGKLDYFEFVRRQDLMQNEKMVVQVIRKGGGDPVTIEVPVQKTRITGMRMRMGRVAAVRDGSPAASAEVVDNGGEEGKGLQPRKPDGDGGDKIIAVEVKTAQGVKRWTTEAESKTDLPLDPLRFALRLARMGSDGGRSESACNSPAPHGPQGGAKQGEAGHTPARMG